MFLAIFPPLGNLKAMHQDGDLLNFVSESINANRMRAFFLFYLSTKTRKKDVRALQFVAVGIFLKTREKEKKN